MKSKLNILILLLSLFFTNQTLAKENITWNRITDADNSIQVYSGVVEGNKLLALRGETKLDFPIEEVSKVLLDVSRKTEWVNSLTEAKIIRSPSKIESIEYNHLKAPWPFKDRDFVFQTTILSNKNDGSVKIHMKSLDDPLMPMNDKYIRGEIFNTTFILKPIDKNHTQFHAEIHADPKGSIPAWLVNLIQKKWPIQTIHGLIEQLQKVEKS